MFDRVFIEKDSKNNAQAIKILNRFKHLPVHEIDKIEDVFGRVRKPYLQKRSNLSIFIGEKRGELVKQAPPAYGTEGDPHYYFVHAYNCVYECEYCYLQGYFNSPDLVFFVNHDDIADQITKITHATPSEQTPWFHAGEYSDSLAMSHLTGEIPFYLELFSQLPSARLELRTKSNNIKEILKCRPLPNVITSFSLSPEKRAKLSEHSVPPISLRLDAISQLEKKGYPIGIHLDPIVYSNDFEESYSELISDLSRVLPNEACQYISLGVVRFTKNVYAQVRKHYPKSDLLAADFVSSFDNKIRYSRPMRMWMMQKIKQLLLDYGYDPHRIYLCMEENQ